MHTHTHIYICMVLEKRKRNLSNTPLLDFTTSYSGATAMAMVSG